MTDLLVLLPAPVCDCGLRQAVGADASLPLADRCTPDPSFTLIAGKGVQVRTQSSHSTEVVGVSKRRRVQARMGNATCVVASSAARIQHVYS